MTSLLDHPYCPSMSGIRVMRNFTSPRFMIGWGLLLVIVLFSLANSAYLVIFDRSWIDGHVAWLFFSIYAFTVLLIPYRHQAIWAWYLTWLFSLPFLIYGLNHINEPTFAPGYLGVAALTAIAQILTWASFKGKAQHS
jgi:hypothetical protein